MSQDQVGRRRRHQHPRTILLACALSAAALTVGPSATGTSADEAPSGTLTPSRGFTIGGDRVAISGTDLDAATFTQVSAGADHTIALATDGTLYGWGLNLLGQLGAGEDNLGEHVTLPVKVDMSGVLKGKNVVEIATGPYHSLALTDDGKVYAWGWNIHGQLGTGVDREQVAIVPAAVYDAGALYGKFVTSIATGDNHTLALTSDGLVYAWGSNLHGQIGNGASGPVVVERPVPIIAPSGSAPIRHIAAGGEHSLSIPEGGGALYAWGRGSEGQLGNNSPSDRTTPTAVPLFDVPAGRTVSATAGGRNHTVIALSDGQVYATGSNSRGQLGNSALADTPTPVPVVGTGAGGMTIEAVAAGPLNSYAIDSDGVLLAWGDNTSRQLGEGTVADLHPAPVAVDRTGTWAGKPAREVSAGEGHVVAKDTAGQVYSWGSNSYGQLGDGTLDLAPRPVLVRTHLVHFGEVSGSGRRPGLDVVVDVAAGTISTTTPASPTGDVEVFVTVIAE